MEKIIKMFKNKENKKIISKVIFTIYIICAIISILLYIQNVKKYNKMKPQEQILKKVSVTNINIAKEFDMNITFNQNEYIKNNSEEFDDIKDIEDIKDVEKDIDITYTLQTGKDSKIINTQYILKTNNIDNIELEKQRLQKQIREENFKNRDLEFETQKENNKYILKADISVYNGQNSTHTIEKINKLFKTKKFKITQKQIKKENN